MASVGERANADRPFSQRLLPVSKFLSWPVHSFLSDHTWLNLLSAPHLSLTWPSSCVVLLSPLSRGSNTCLEIVVGMSDVY